MVRPEWKLSNEHCKATTDPPACIHHRQPAVARHRHCRAVPPAFYTARDWRRAQALRIPEPAPVRRATPASSSRTGSVTLNRFGLLKILEELRVRLDHQKVVGTVKSGPVSIKTAIESVKNPVLLVCLSIEARCLGINLPADFLCLPVGVRQSHCTLPIRICPNSLRLLRPAGTKILGDP